MIKKKLSLLLGIIFLIGIVSANLGYEPDLGFSCGGDNNSLVSCLGPANTSNFIGGVPPTPHSGVPSRYYQNITQNAVSPRNFHSNIGMAILILLIILITIFFIIFFIVKRKKKKNLNTI